MPTRILVIATVLFVFFTGQLPAQEDSPEETFTAIKETCVELNIRKTQTHMTSEAGMSLVRGTIINAASSIESAFPPGPEADKHRKRLREIFADHKIDMIKCPKGHDYSMGPPNAETLRKLEQQKNEFISQVIKTVEDQNGLLNDINRATAESPFPMGPSVMFRLGEITEIDISDDQATAIVEVDSSRLSNDRSVVNVMPPTPIKFVLVDGDWKYSGIDEIKQRALVARHLDLHMRRRPMNAPGNGISIEVASPIVDRGDVSLTANWIPFDEESTYGFAEKWPEINEMKPVAETRKYESSFFASLAPKPQIQVGDTWRINENAMLPFLKQFHDGASVELHHNGPTGAYGCLVGQKEDLQNILIRLHGELRHKDGWYYTVSQFEGHLVWDSKEKKVKSFRLFVPPVRTNVDINRSMTTEEYNNKDKLNVEGLMGVDIGFIPKMELATEITKEDFQWDTTIDLNVAKHKLSLSFYHSAKINWLPFEDAVVESQETGKPLLVVALFGTLFDESC